MTKIYKKMIKKCNKTIDFNRLVRLNILVDNLKEYEKERVETLQDIKYKINKLKSIKSENSELNHDIVIFENQRILNDIKLKKSQALRKRVLLKIEKEFPKKTIREFKYDIFSKSFENVIIGYTLHDNWTITGIYHNTISKETFTTSLLYNSEVDYFSDAFIFNDIINKYNASVVISRMNEISQYLNKNLFNDKSIDDIRNEPFSCSGKLCDNIDMSKL